MIDFVKAAREESMGDDLYDKLADEIGRLRELLSVEREGGNVCARCGAIAFDPISPERDLPPDGWDEAEERKRDSETNLDSHIEQFDKAGEILKQRSLKSELDK